ncbi:ciliogenesis and planar polarity effector 1 [Sphaeramia orbicularis]|uniref:ciliogenesis and planar polarity effector 1 n=1 Tax=Sphaeramia orbicularis TaxID=375764 RepID=UPI00117F1941|nr:ciliogenesis and planar polarity effector 1 [Sphaeramia orbicularis]
MELKLEVVLSSSIKRKKPWPRFCWLGQEKESVFLLDDKRISEINMVSGRTKRRTPKLHPLLNNVVTMGSSHNGVWLCGLLGSGELFLWNRDKDMLKTTSAVPEVVQMISEVQGHASKLCLQVSGDGTAVLLVAVTGHVFLWECLDVRDLMGMRDCTVSGTWAQIQPLEDTLLPSARDKEASVHTMFVKTETFGDTCLSAFVFTSGKKLIITFLKIQWQEGQLKLGPVDYSVHWSTQSYPMARLTPPCQPVKSRGALVPAFSPDGNLLAIVLNQRQPRATQVLFISTQNFVSVSRCLGGCGSKKKDIPSKYIRSYWVGSVSWSADGLFLACVLKRGSLLMLPRLGGLLTLSSLGCNVDFGPAHFLPLHPLVTYRPPLSAGKADLSLSNSSISLRDVMRQRYSVTWHPRLLYLIVSDGYMATLLKVKDRTTPALLLKTILMDTSRDLERASQRLDKSEPHVRAWLDSVSCLNLESSLEDFSHGVSRRPNTTDWVTSGAADRLPLFLQDQGTMGNTRELLEKVQNVFEEDSDLDGVPAGSHVEDGGHLEFASMFDTLHALDTFTDSQLLPSPDFEKHVTVSDRKIPPLPRELEKIQTKLLSAWAFGLSLGNCVEHGTHLLKHTLTCVVRFAALLHLLPSSTVHTGEASTSLLLFLKALLHFLPWNAARSDGSQCIGLLIEFSRRLVRLVLTPDPESYQTGHCQLSSHSLSAAMRILQLVSDSLDHTYSLQQRQLWFPVPNEAHSQSPQLSSLDLYHVPLLQTSTQENPHTEHQTRPALLKPSSRLHGVWRYVYVITQQYMEELKNVDGCDSWEAEHQQISTIMSEIQVALQATGERLEEGSTLLDYTGEHLFLCGFYSKSAEMWQRQIWEESKKSCDHSLFQEKRLCLALLYSLLSQYHLREAQELGDHMAHLILQRAPDQDLIRDDSPPCSWLPVDLSTDTACAVVQTLGRFMASYFANQPLYIMPPHSVDVLPPLHVPHAPSIGRLVPLCQEEVARAVRQQQLSEIWTVEYAQDLLLLGGLLPETVWVAYHVGDWRTAVSLSLAYTSYCTQLFDFTRLRRREFHLPTALEPASLFKEGLDCLLCSKDDSQQHKEKDGDKSFTVDPLEGEDWDLLQVSIQEILKASVMAAVDVLSSPLSSLLDTAKDLCACLTAIVPGGLYLPSPPLYCPQPSPNTQDPVGTLVQFTEVASRHEVSGVLRRLLLLLRSARCCLPAAQWYISQLRRVRHLLHKIKKKYSYPGVSEEEKAFPEALMKFIGKGGFFRRGPHKDSHLDGHSGITQAIICFRELCGLCWMLHVRDQLSISCRKYQAARQHDKDKQIPNNSEVRSTCVDALRWACRYLPFSRFLNAEEICQDMVLSLVSELPPFSLVADTVAQAFPEEEESVRVPLREKYNSLLQTLRRCDVLEEDENEEGNESMMILIGDKLRQRKKHLRRLQRHLGPLELHLWEKEMEEDDWGSKHGMAMLRQLSLGTSLSTSSLTDCGFPPVYSDGDTIENISEAPVSPKQHKRPTTRSKKAKMLHRGDAQNIAVRIESVIKEESHSGDTKDNDSHLKSKQPSLPVVGTWEFELEDEEYLNFLQVFLSYVLEKDFADGVNTSNELPLLKDFSLKLRERELHSLTFDVLTTMHRRQRDKHHESRRKSTKEPPVFRAGCCFRQMKQGPTSLTSSISEAHISRSTLSVDFLSDLKAGVQKGLFAPRKQSSGFLHQRTKPGHCSSKTSPIRSAVSTEQSSACWFGSSASVDSMMELQQGLDPKLDAQFPELGRLLEWMVRWADRRGPLGHHGKKRERERGEGAADGGVVLRVKASVPAVLTSLSLTESKYSALFRTDRYTAHIQVPQTQWIVAPVLKPALDGKLEREGGVDRCRPESTNTSITVHDHSPQPEVSIVSEVDEQAIPTTHVHDNSQQTFETPIRTSGAQQLLLDDLDVTPEKEGKSCHSDVPEDSSSVSSENSCTPQTSLKLADLNISENMSISDLMYRKTTAHEEFQTPPAAQPEPVVHAGSDPPEVQLSNVPTDPSLEPHSSTAGGPTTVPSATDQPSCSPQAPQIRRLGEDLFRLVQNINYISLMEVLDTSFSNLQLAQQNSSVAQSNVNPLNSNVTFPYARNFIPQLNSVPVQTNVSVVPQTQTSGPNSGSEKIHFSQAPPCTHVFQPSTSYQHHTTRNVPPTGSGASAQCQEMQPLSVQAESPAVQFRESRTLIPCSQGLLTTTDSSHAVHSVPAVVPSNDSIQSDPVPLVSGLKLLQLHPPRLPQQSASHCFPVQQTPNPAAKECSQSKPNVSGQTGTSVPRRQLDFNRDSTHNLPPRSFQLQNQMSDRSKAQELPVFSPGLFAHTHSNPLGLRLLHFEPDSRSNVMFPKLPTQASSRPSPTIVPPMGGTQKIKLLRIESQPKMMCPPAASPVQMARLIPLEELAYSVKMRNIEEAQLQLLQVERPSESTDTTAACLTSSSSKRQKRRDKMQKAEVTFKPNVSIIPTQEPSDEPAILEEITDGPDVARTLGSLVTGQTLVEKAMSTAAELHAFASTCKRPPECHDAFTNTDPARPPTLVYKAVSVQTSVNAGSPKLQNFRNQPEDKDSPVGSKKDEMNLCLDGRQFLSVLDLEDKSLHQDLPPSLTLSPQTPNPPLIPASPTSASLHILATSVLTTAPTDDVDLQTSVDCPEDLMKPSTHPDSPQNAAPLSPSENGGEADGMTADQSDSEVCRALKAHRVESCTTSSSTLPPRWFSSRLSELDSQLAALQNIADGLEKDFSNSRMLVNAIEKLSPVLASDVKTTTILRKTVRLAVPHEAWTPQLDTLIEPKACEEEEEEEGHVADEDSRTLSVYSTKPGPSSLHTPTKFKEQLGEVNGISEIWTEDNLGQSELSDTAEILDELVREGYISQTDLDLSMPHTDDHRSRLEVHQSSWMSQDRVLPEDERRELRVWMRRKQRERLAVYQKHREALREREHRPFSSSGTLRSTNKTQQTVCRTRAEKEKVKLLEQYYHRTLEACSLAAAPPPTPGSLRADRPTTAPPSNSTYRVSSAPVSDGRSLDYQLRPRSQTGWQGWSSEDYRRRLGLHRPVTSLPKDRLSQVTRRGMITNTKRGGKVHIRHPRTAVLNTMRGTQTEQKKKDKTQMDQWWKSSAEPWRLSDTEETDKTIPAGACDPQADAPAGGGSGMDWLDRLSDSGGSSLSKIDWAAIERMVADEES